MTLPGAGARTDLATSSQVMSPVEFAAKGIHGLPSEDTGGDLLGLNDDRAEGYCTVLGSF